MEYRVEIALEGVVRIKAATPDRAREKAMESLHALHQAGLRGLGSVFGGKVEATTLGEVETHRLNPDNAKGPVKLGSV